MEAITRTDQYLAALSGLGDAPAEPITRIEHYFAYMLGQVDEYPEPITREERYLAEIIKNGGSGGGSYDQGYAEAIDTFITGTITSVSSQATKIRGYCFISCNWLLSASFPNLQALESYTFRSCNRLKTAYVPVVTSVGANAFSGCGSLELVDFSGCTAVPTLDNVNAFASVPTTCEIRVPAALVEEWKAATNWSNFADQIIGV